MVEPETTSRLGHAKGGRRPNAIFLEGYIAPQPPGTINCYVRVRGPVGVTGTAKRGHVRSHGRRFFCRWALPAQLQGQVRESARAQLQGEGHACR